MSELNRIRFERVWFTWELWRNGKRFMHGTRGNLKAAHDAAADHLRRYRSQYPKSIFAAYVQRETQTISEHMEVTVTE